jgi:zinc protease
MPALALAAAGLAAVAVPGRGGTLDPAHVKETVFPSGLRLVVKEAHATELVSVQVWVRAGGFLEDESSSGTAHVIEHLAFKGTETYTPGSIDAEIENLGGVLEASTEKDWTRFSCTVNGRYVAKVLGIVADAVRKPEFRQQDWEAEKPVIQSEIDLVALSPEAALSAALYQLAFQKHPYRFDVRGSKRFLDQLTLEQVRAYYRRHYLPSRMVVVVVGDVDPAGVERVTRTAFQAEQAGAAEPLKLPEEERACQKAERRVLQSRFAGGFLGIAYAAPSVKNEPQVYAMDILLTMLEHGGSGRLPRILRGTAAVQATFETRRQAGLFSVIAATGATNPEQVEALIRREIDFLSSRPISPEELSVAKRQLRGSYALDNEPYSGQAATLGYYAAIDRWQFASDYLAKVEAVTAEQVQEVAREYLSPDRSVTVLLQPQGPPARAPRSGT